MADGKPAGPTLALGGVRSGKSAFAEGLVGGMGLPVLYLATGMAVDEAFAQRIRRHQESRPADWVTVEAPLDPAASLEPALPDGRQQVRRAGRLTGHLAQQRNAGI